MSNYQITTDSTCDMAAEFYQSGAIPVVGLAFVMEGKEYQCGLRSEMPLETFYEKIGAGITATTNQANVADHEELFSKVAEEGKSVLHISFSSGLSGTCQSAKLAMGELQERYPALQFWAVDSLCASHGEGLLLYYALENQKAGMSLEENARWLEEHKLNLCHWFTVNDLEHLYRGGRVSKTAAVMGTMLGIKPVLHVDDAGKLIPVEKIRGRAKAVDALLTHMKATIQDPQDQLILIGHTLATEEAERLAAQVRSAFPMVKDVRILPIGPVIASHTGIGVVSLFFLGSKR